MEYAEFDALSRPKERPAQAEIVSASVTQVDQGIHDRLELGPRFQELDVGVGLDLLGQLGVGIDRLAQEYDGAAEVIPRQPVAIGLRELGVAADLSNQPRQDLRGSKQAWARLELETVLGTSKAMRAASS